MATKKTPPASLVVRAKEPIKLRVVAKAETAAEADRLAREALDYIARLERRAHLELVVETGDYLIQTFFGGDIELAQSLDAVKPVALNRLFELAPTREIPESRLRYAIGLSLQYRALPATVRDRLTTRQHRALLPVKNPRDKSRLARKAVSEHLAADDLARLVRAERGPSPAGRKPLPEVERAIGAARRVLGASTLEADLMPGRLRALPADAKERIRRDAIVVRERVEKILDGLR